MLQNEMFLVLFKINCLLFGRGMMREKFSFHEKPRWQIKVETFEGDFKIHVTYFHFSAWFTFTFQIDFNNTFTFQLDLLCRERRRTQMDLHGQLLVSTSILHPQISYNSRWQISIILIHKILYNSCRQIWKIQPSTIHNPE